MNPCTQDIDVASLSGNSGERDEALTSNHPPNAMTSPEAFFTEAPRPTVSEVEQSTSGIPVIHESLADILDEGQNSLNAWRLRKHMEGEYSGTLIEELVGTVERVAG